MSAGTLPARGTLSIHTLERCYVYKGVAVAVAVAVAGYGYAWVADRGIRLLLTRASTT